MHVGCGMTYRCMMINDYLGVKTFVDWCVHD